MATHPQGYWIDNKFVFTPALPHVWPEPDAELAEVAAPVAHPVLSGSPQSIFGDSEPGVTGNVRHGWAKNVDDNLGRAVDWFSERIGGSDAASPVGEAVPVAAAPAAMSARGGALAQADSPKMGEEGYKDPQGREYDVLGQEISPETQGIRNIRDWASYIATAGFNFPGLGSFIGMSRAGDLSNVRGPYSMVEGKHRYNAPGPMGTLQAPRGHMQIGYSPTVFEWDWTGAYNLGTVGNTGRSVTPAMLDEYGLKGGLGYGYGFKKGGGFGALTANDVDDPHIDPSTNQAWEPGLAPPGITGSYEVDGSTVGYEGFSSPAAAESYGSYDDPGGWGPAFHEGGFVEGPDPEVEGEEFTAEMLEGEYVIQPKAVELINKIFGEDFLDRLNALANDQ